jgi:hypothetical protein
MSSTRILFLAALTLALPSAAPAFADAESDLRARWTGATVITKVPVFSECTDHFTDNAVPSGGLPRGAGLRFGAGEIATVDKIDVTWTRIDVSIGFLEPYRVTWTDGPYTLYDQRRCRVQLKLELPADVRKDPAKAGAANRRAARRLLQPRRGAARAVLQRAPGRGLPGQLGKDARRIRDLARDTRERQGPGAHGNAAPRSAGHDRPRARRRGPISAASAKGAHFAELPELRLLRVGARHLLRELGLVREPARLRRRTAARLDRWAWCARSAPCFVPAGPQAQ